MSENDLRLAIVGGLGVMTTPMAQHWKKEGPIRAVRVHDRGNPGEEREKPRRAWREHGAQLVASYAELVGSDGLDGVVICAGKNGDDFPIVSEVAKLLRERGGNQFICHMSTVSTGFAESAFQYCSQLGVTYVNYPLTGGAIGARNAKQLILAGGDRALYDRLAPGLMFLGTPRYFGSRVAAGAEVKFIGHLLVFNGLMAISSAAAVHSECFQEGQLGGEDQTSFFDFLNAGAGGTRQWDVVLKFAVKETISSPASHSSTLPSTPSIRRNFASTRGSLCFVPRPSFKSPSSRFLSL